MTLTIQEQALDIKASINRIEDIISKGELPNNLAGDLMSQSHIERHDRLSKRLADLYAHSE